MQVFNTLRQVLDTATAVKDITDHKKTYIFNVVPPITFYMQAEYANINLIRWDQPRIELHVKLQMAPGWRIATEQDEVGVYIVIKRRMIVGGLSTARFEVFVPDDTHVVMKLVESDLQLGRVHGQIEIPPPAKDGNFRLHTSTAALTDQIVDQKNLD